MHSDTCYRSGGSLIRKVDTTDPEVCAEACCGDATCTHFTVNTADPPACHLKAGAAGTPYMNATCTSGTRAAPPAPADCQFPPTNKPAPVPADPAFPNVILFIGDDIGWSDVGFTPTKNTLVSTPTMDGLAADGGVLLNQFYGGPQCTPSRAGIMSSRYPSHVGLAHHVLSRNLRHLPLSIFTTMDQMGFNGYDVVSSGKWHLGQASRTSTPLERGSAQGYYGYLGGAEDYYKHELLNATSPESFVVNGDDTGKYSAPYFSDEVIDAIHAKSDKPLFAYLAYQNSHMPLQLPPYTDSGFASRYPRIVEMIKSGTNKPRTTMIAMTSWMDYEIARVVNATKDAGTYNQTVFIWISDNGGPSEDHAMNYPLRGGKHTLWEGGVRNVAFIHDGRRSGQPGRVYNGLMHGVDVMPTLVEGLLGRKLVDDGYPVPRDGVNQWSAIFDDSKPFPRTEILHNLDGVTEDSWFGGYVALRSGDWKLMLGNPGTPNYWCSEQEGGSSPYPKPPPSVAGKDFCARQNGPFPCPGDKCAHTAGPYWPAVQLYNISADPTELNDVSKSFPDVVSKLTARIAEFNQTATCLTPVCVGCPSSNTPTNQPWVTDNKLCSVITPCTQSPP